MKASSRKRFRHGFVLTEQELRRLLDVLVQQMKRIATMRRPVVQFQLDFRNGATAQTNSIDEVLSLENAGSGTVTRLKVVLQDKEDGEEPTNQIYLEFTDVNAGGSGFGGTSVCYAVEGEDRDWVFITSSELEERINKIKVSAPGRFVCKEVALMAMTFILLAVAFGAILPAEAQRVKSRFAAIEKIEQAYRRGAIRDPLEAMIMLEKETLSVLPAMGILRRVILVAGGLLLFFIALWLFIDRLFPAYNFCWGDYLGLYERKLAIRRYILIVVVTGIIVSAIGGFIVDRLSPGR